MNIIKKYLFYKNRSNNDNFNHGDVIECLAKIMKPKLYVELGLYRSEVLRRIVPHADELIGTDINPNSKKYFPKNPKAHFFCLTSDELLEKLKKEGRKIDLLFIDADHSCQSVLNDFNNYFPLVSDQGLILLHDGFPKNAFYTQSGYCSDCYKAIMELSKNTERYEMVTIPKHPGLTICRKRKNHLSWF